MSGSAWWPIDVPASRWFTEEERAASRRYHDPIQRAAVIRGAAQLAFLLVVWWWARRSSAGVPGAVAAVMGAITVPRLGVDAWHEFVHEPRFGGRPVQRSAFAMTVTGRLAVEGAVLAVVAWLLIGRETEAWLASVLAAAVASAIPMISARVGPHLVLALHRAVEVDPGHPSRVAVSDAASQFGLACPRLVMLDETVLDGVNAYVVGRHTSPVVAVSQSLLDGPPDLLAHVVAHEMAHVSRRHVVWSAAAAAVALASTAFVAVSVTLRWESGAARLPLLVIVAVIVAAPFRLVTAWTSRAHERRADQLALDIAPVSPELVGQLHLSDRPLLEPGRLAALLHSHPTPSERVESAARRWSSALRN